MVIVVHEAMNIETVHEMMRMSSINEFDLHSVSSDELETVLFDVDYTHLLLKNELSVSTRVQDVLDYRGVVLIRTRLCTLYSIVSEEGKYLELMMHVKNQGSMKLDRTRVGTMSQFGKRLKFSLLNHRLPLMTTKRVFVRGVLEELMWFLRGSTDSTELSDRNVHIWDRNGSKEKLTALGFRHRNAGDLGPVYGFQWRHWGATYEDKDTRHRGGVDQINRVVEQLITNPDSRRHVVSAWNVSDLDQMALPPCHMFFQFYVRDGKFLSCQMTQRSADMFLGVPFNIASYAILTHIVAKLTNLVAEELTITFGDTHVYTNHMDAVLEQCARKPNRFPTVRVGNIQSIDDLTVSDVQVEDYACHSAIHASMAV